MVLQDLPNMKKNHTLDFFYMQIDISERRAEKQDGPTMIIEGPPGPTNINIFFTI